MRTPNVESPLYAYMARVPDARRNKGHYDAMVIVLQPEFAAEGHLVLGQFCEMHTEPEAAPGTLAYRVPIMAAVRGGLAKAPYQLVSRQEWGQGFGEHDIGYVFSDQLPAQPPLIFDVDPVPEGIYWINIGSTEDFVPVKIWHPAATADPQTAKVQ